MRLIVPINLEEPIPNLQRVTFAAALALASIPGCGRRPGLVMPVTILVQSGRLGSVESAAVAEDRVDWWDDDSSDDDACTESFAAVELRRFLARSLGIDESQIRFGSEQSLPRRGDVFVIGNRRSNRLIASLLGPEHRRRGGVGEGHPMDDPGAFFGTPDRPRGPVCEEGPRVHQRRWFPCRLARRTARRAAASSSPPAATASSRSSSIHAPSIRTTTRSGGVENKPPDPYAVGSEAPKDLDHYYPTGADGMRSFYRNLELASTNILAIEHCIGAFGSTAPAD